MGKLGEYNAGVVKPNQVRISPSSIAQLSDNELIWYRNAVLHENTFLGSTATRLGTLTHYRVEQYLKGLEQPLDEEVIAWMEKSLEPDQWRVMDDSKAMFEAFLSGYKEHLTEKVESEVWVQYEPNDSIILSGTADIIMGDTILDIKTTSKLKSSISDYWMQLYTLAYISRMSGNVVNNIGVIYLVSPTKTISARYVYVVEPIDEDKMNSFIDWLQKKVKKILYAKENDMADILLSRNLLSFRT